VVSKFGGGLTWACSGLALCASVTASFLFKHLSVGEESGDTRANH
jgi:hypothetical protein